MQVRVVHGLTYAFMTVGTEAALRLDQQAGFRTFMGLMAGQTTILAHGGMGIGRNGSSRVMALTAQGIWRCGQKSVLTDSSPVGGVTAEAVTARYRAVPFYTARLLTSGFIEPKGMTVEAKGFFILARQESRIAGMRGMAGPAASFTHDSMGIFCGKFSLFITMTAVTGRFFIRGRQSIAAKIGTIMAIATSPLLHRLVNGNLQKRRPVRRMCAVAIRTAPFNGIASVLFSMHWPLQVMAGSTEGLFIQGQQIRCLTAMHLVAGFAALGQRRMPMLPGKNSGVVAGQTESFFRVFEQGLLFGVVGVVADQTLARVSRRMRKSIIGPGRVDLGMAVEAEFGHLPF